jgi:hypothetical protein
MSVTFAHIRCGALKLVPFDITVDYHLNLLYLWITLPWSANVRGWEGQVKLMNCRTVLINRSLCVVFERWVLIQDLVFRYQQKEISALEITREHLKQLAAHHWMNELCRSTVVSGFCEMSCHSGLDILIPQHCKKRGPSFGSHSRRLETISNSPLKVSF